MRSRLFLAAAIAVLVVLNLLVWQKERIARDGRPVLLELAPVDPRSIMQGDYMRLSWQIEREVPAQPLARAIVVSVDERGVGHFVRVGQEAGPQEQVIRVGPAPFGVRLGPDAWYFEEGQAAAYAAARYGELRCDTGGACVLVGLRDKDLRPLGP